MIIDLDEIRSEFARHLTESTHKKHTMDSALFHVVKLVTKKVEASYQDRINELQTRIKELEHGSV